MATNARLLVYMFCIVPLLFCAPAPLLGGDEVTEPSVKVLMGGTVIDGTGRPPIANAVVLIKGSKVESITRAGEISVPEEAHVIDVSGQYVLPGLIDMHVHYADWMPELFLAHGVTSVVDLAGYDWVYVQKEGIAKGNIPGPRLFASSPILDGRLFWNVPFVLLKDADEARARAKAAVEFGVDLLKVYTEIGPSKVRAIVEEARKAGLPVMGHVGAIDAREAAELGVDGLAHATGIALATIGDAAKRQEMREFERIGISVDYPHFLLYHAYMDEQKAKDLIELLVQEEVALEPDLINTAARFVARQRDRYKREDEELLRNPALNYVPESYKQRALYYEEPLMALTSAERGLLGKGYANLQAFLRAFVGAGGRVLAGSDTASFVLPGVSLHREMELLVDAGLSPMDAIVSATGNNASFLRRKDVGTLTAGTEADLFCVTGDPLKDIRNTQEIVLVMKAGRVLDTTYHRDFRNPVPSPPLPWGYFANPPPHIELVTPQVARAGSKGHSVTIHGKNFLDSSVVRFAGEFVSARPVPGSQIPGTAYLRHYAEMKATIPEHLITKVGTYPLTVTNPEPEGGVSAPGYIIVKF